MLKTIEYIREKGLDQLVRDFKLNAVHHKTLPLVLLKYDQIDSPKYHEITRECRTLILEKETWQVVAKSFRRFYNFGEAENNDTFDWSHYYIQEKCDGSLITLWYYADSWHISTSGSFGDAYPCPEVPYTWRDLVWKVLDKEKVAGLCRDHTYIFELTSPYNKVVLNHREIGLTLLSVFCRESCRELSFGDVDWVAGKLGVPRPRLFSFNTVSEALAWCEQQTELIEGMVYVDHQFNRFKAKNPLYVHLHHLKNNDNFFLMRNLVPLVLNKASEKDEILTYFPELKEKWNSIELKLSEIFKDADEIHQLYPDYNQKQFAAAIKSEPKFLQSMLFTARKMVQKPSALKKNFEPLLVKMLDGKF